MFHGKRGRTPLIGPVGGLIQLHGSSSVDVTRPARTTKSVALSDRVTSQRGGTPRREWAVSVSSAYPEHFQALRQLEAGLFGPGPFVFYDEYAQVTNILAPTQASLAPGHWVKVTQRDGGGQAVITEPATQGGAGTASDGTLYLRSITSGVSQEIEMVGTLAVPSKYPLSVAAYLSTHPANSGTLYVDEIDPEGALVGTHQATVGANEHAKRAVVSIKTSVRTVAIRLRVVGALMTALPSVTLTDRAMPWDLGNGCPTVTFDLPNISIKKAVAQSNGRRASYSMTVHELG